MKAPTTALSPIESDPIDKSSSLYSFNFVNPTPCDALPIATPRLIAVSILNSLNNTGPKMAPVNPATITITAVSGGIPPTISLTCIATGVVNDFGNEVSIKSLLEPKSISNATTLTRPASIATIMLVIIEYLYLKISSRWLYKGNANATTAGPSILEIHCPPSIYVSYGILKTSRIMTVMQVAVKIGNKNGCPTFKYSLFNNTKRRTVLLMMNRISSRCSNILFLLHFAFLSFY